MAASGHLSHYRHAAFQNAGLLVELGPALVLVFCLFLLAAGRPLNAAGGAVPWVDDLPDKIHAAINGLQDVGVDLDDADFDSLQSEGFCAVLFDHLLADTARTASIDVEGRDLAVTRASDFQNDRYEVFLLQR